MAGFFQQFLKGAADGFLGSPFLKDYKHASKTFIPSGYQNSPKYKWLFHVYFKINKEFVAKFDLENIFPSTANYGLLVKNIQLPKFDMKLEEMNQYNRKRYVQTKMTYAPLRIAFHDDNRNQIRKLWETYFRYYYYDMAQPSGFNRNKADMDIYRSDSSQLNKKNIYDNELRQEVSSWGYSGAPSAGQDQKYPFFESIRVYGFNQHNFALYDIVNPIIENFSHDDYNYNETTSTMENTMTIKYENVKYYEGSLNGQKPEAIVDGFGNPKNYDTELSPIARIGNNRSIMGPGGLVDAGKGILSDITSGNVLGALQKAGRVSKTFKNSKQIISAAKSELLSGAIGLINSNSDTIRNAANTVTAPINGALTGLSSQITNSLNNKTGTLNTKPPTIPGGP